AATTTAGCGPEDLQLPATPQLDMLVQAYAMPTGTIDPQHLDQLMAEARARIDMLQLDWLPDLLSAALIRLRARLVAQGLSTDPAVAHDSGHPNIDALIVLRQICVGWDDPPGPPDAAANGSLVLISVIDTDVLRRTMTATATACHSHIQASNTFVQAVTPDVKGFIDGDLGFYFYDKLPTRLTEVQVLVAFNGQIGRAGGAMPSGSFDFRLFYPNVDFRLTQPDGDVIVGVGLGGVTLQGANATYHCDVAVHTCSAT